MTVDLQAVSDFLIKELGKDDKQEGEFTGVELAQLTGGSIYVIRDMLVKARKMGLVAGRRSTNKNIPIRYRVVDDMRWKTFMEGRL